MSEGLWTTKSLMPSEKEKKPLEEASGHFSFSLSGVEVFSLSRRKEREAESGATRLASKPSESAFHGNIVGEPLL